MTRDDDQEPTSTRPYLIRALHEWCTDNGYAPHIAVSVDGSVRVPKEFVRNGEIVLNLGVEATSGLRLGNEYIEFKARFGGVARDVVVPVSHVIAIYARENGQGMAFPRPEPVGEPQTTGDLSPTLPDVAEQEPGEAAMLRSVPASESDDGSPVEEPDPPSGGPGRGAGRPQLKLVK